MKSDKKLSSREPAVSDEQDEKKTLHPDYEAFLQWKRTRKTKESTLLTMKRRFLRFPPPDGLTEEYFENRMNATTTKGEQVSNKTVRLELTYAKMFLKWAKRDFSHLQGFDLGKMEKSVVTEDLYTPEELRAIFVAAEPLRDRPMLEVLYESACRAGEILSMTCESIRPGKGDTLIVNVKGKTGNRDIILEHSAPNLQRWRDYHPTKKGLLWISQKRDENGDYQALSLTGLYLVAQKTIRRAGVTGKKRILHMFRHTRITELHKIGMQGLNLHGYVGWTEGSPMEKVYVHLDNGSILDEYYRLHGYSEQEQPREALQRVTCPKCGTDNGPAENWCKSCHEALTQFARNLQEQSELEKQVATLETAYTDLHKKHTEIQEFVKKEVQQEIAKEQARGLAGASVESLVRLFHALATKPKKETDAFIKMLKDTKPDKSPEQILQAANEFLDKEYGTTVIDGVIHVDKSKTNKGKKSKKQSKKKKKQTKK